MGTDHCGVLTKDRTYFGDREWKNALVVVTNNMSSVQSDKTIVDADEHGIVFDPQITLQVNDHLFLMLDRYDPTCNRHNWHVGVRSGIVKCLQPVSARG